MEDGSTDILLTKAKEQSDYQFTPSKSMSYGTWVLGSLIPQVNSDPTQV